jgi:hypothetical protein
LYTFAIGKFDGEDLRHNTKSFPVENIRNDPIFAIRKKAQKMFHIKIKPYATD